MILLFRHSLGLLKGWSELSLIVSANELSDLQRKGGAKKHLRKRPDALA